MDTTENNWASITLVTLDGEPLTASKKILLVAAGRAENTGMEWNEDQTTVGGNWGESPPLVEGIPALISFEGMDGLKVYRLPISLVGTELLRFYGFSVPLFSGSDLFKAVFHLLIDIQNRRTVKPMNRRTVEVAKTELMGNQHALKYRH